VIVASPNPARGSVALRFDLPLTEITSVRVLDVTGRSVRNLVAARAPGVEVTWDGRDDHGLRVAAGTYFLRLEWLGGTATSRVVLIR
jgi:hypothetical protein